MSSIDNKQLFIILNKNKQWKISNLISYEILKISKTKKINRKQNKITNEHATTNIYLIQLSKLNTKNNIFSVFCMVYVKSYITKWSAFVAYRNMHARSV